MQAVDRDYASSLLSLAGSRTPSYAMPCCGVRYHKTRDICRLCLDSTLLFHIQSRVTHETVRRHRTDGRLLDAYSQHWKYGSSINAAYYTVNIAAACESGGCIYDTTRSVGWYFSPPQHDSTAFALSRYLRCQLGFFEYIRLLLTWNRQGGMALTTAVIRKRVFAWLYHTLGKLQISCINI